MSEPTRRRIAEAALTLFARHGYQRTTMADVARAAKVSRATLYLKFADKTAIFANLAEQLANDALTAAEGAWREEAAFADNLAETLLAKDLPLFRLLHASPHGAELMAVDAELTRAHAARLDLGMVSLLARRAAAATRLDFAVFGGPKGFGRFIATAAGGLKHEARDEAAYRAAIRRLAAVAARAAAPTLPEHEKETSS